MSRGLHPRLRGWVIGGAFFILPAALMAIHAGEPWRFPNDDNGAWFSAVARSHLYVVTRSRFAPGPG